NTVGIVQKMVSSTEAQNQRSTRLSYQENTSNNVNKRFENSKPSINDEFWANYQHYLLKDHNKQTTNARMLYAKKYFGILKEENVQELLLLSNQKRMHVMKALAALSKYAGCYDRWRNIKERYQLKWSNEDSLETFNSIM